MPDAIMLVLLPGMDGTGELFTDFVAALSPTTHASVVSYPPDQPLAYAALTSLVCARLPTRGPYVLLGESFSGPIAVALAATHPPGLCGVVLCCSFVRSPRPALTSLARLLPQRAMPSSVLSRVLLGRFASPRTTEELARALARVSPATILARLRAIADVDATEELSRVRVPVLYLRATEDRVVPRAASRLVARLLPSIRMVDVEGPHLLLQTVPHATARAVDVFVRGLAVIP